MYGDPCLHCGWYELDIGCTCPTLDLWYQCPLEEPLSKNDFENEEE